VKFDQHEINSIATMALAMCLTKEMYKARQRGEEDNVAFFMGATTVVHALRTALNLHSSTFSEEPFQFTEPDKRLGPQAVFRLVVVQLRTVRDALQAMEDGVEADEIMQLIEDAFKRV
jgi:hypothetical protein